MLVRNLTFTVAACMAASSLAAEFKPAVVYDLGGKFDKSFNEGVYSGVQRFEKETGISVLEFEVKNETQREQALERMVNRGASIVLGIGFGQADAMAKVSAAHPDVKFAIIDVDWLEGDNLRQYSFKEHEGSYLVGIAAALASSSDKVGFVGGMDIPLIRRFACGYVQGFKSVSPSGQVFQNMTGTTPAAWNDPTKGGELARSQFDRGADVVYAAAGGTGIGVYQAAKDSGKLAIGVDSNQNHLQPGTMLTSMLKRVDLAAYQTFKDAHEGNFTAGVIKLGIAEDGVGWALDEHNASLVSSAMKSRIAEAQKKIASGALSVHDYMADNSCPAK